MGLSCSFNLSVNIMLERYGLKQSCATTYVRLLMCERLIISSKNRIMYNAPIVDVVHRLRTHGAGHEGWARIRRGGLASGRSHVHGPRDALRKRVPRRVQRDPRLSPASQAPARCRRAAQAPSRPLAGRRRIRTRGRQRPERERQQSPVRRSSTRSRHDSEWGCRAQTRSGRSGRRDGRMPESRETLQSPAEAAAAKAIEASAHAALDGVLSGACVHGSPRRSLHGVRVGVVRRRLVVHRRCLLHIHNAEYHRFRGHSAERSGVGDAPTHRSLFTRRRPLRALLREHSGMSYSTCTSIIQYYSVLIWLTIASNEYVIGWWPGCV